MSMDVVQAPTDCLYADAVDLNDLRVRPEFAAMLSENGLDSVEALFKVCSATNLGKPGLDPWRQRLRVTVRDGGAERVLYIKRYENPPPRAVREAKRAGARSVAGVEWCWIERLARAGIPTVRAVAVGESFRGGRESRSVLVTDAVPGASLEALVGAWRSGRHPGLRSWITPVAELVSRMHGLGYVHRDLYLSHIFLDEASGSESPLRLIDLHRMRRPTWNQRRWIIKDLAGLNYATPASVVSTADRLRWLKCYLGRSRLDSDSRRLIYRIVGKTQRIARHDARRKAQHSPGARGSGGVNL